MPLSEPEDCVINAVHPTELDPRVYRIGAFQSGHFPVDEQQAMEQRRRFYEVESLYRRTHS